jgi:hypothetical protein
MITWHRGRSIPLLVDHVVHNAIGWVTELSANQGGLRFIAEVEDSAEGRLLPDFCEAYGSPINGDGVGCVAVSAFFSGCARQSTEEGVQVESYETITELFEISVLTSESRPALHTSFATFSLSPEPVTVRTDGRGRPLPAERRTA